MSNFQQGLREAGLIIIVACVLAFSYTATMEKGLFATPSEKTAVSAPGSGPQMIELAEAKQIFDEGKYLFIDSRHEFDYKLGHIKGAMNIPLSEYDQRIGVMGDYPRDRLIIVYCDGADCNSSIEFASKMFLGGFTNVKIFYGGWREWTANNYPIEKEAEPNQ